MLETWYTSHSPDFIRGEERNRPVKIHRKSSQAGTKAYCLDGCQVHWIKNSKQFFHFKTSDCKGVGPSVDLFHPQLSNHILCFLFQMIHTSLTIYRVCLCTPSNWKIYFFLQPKVQLTQIVLVSFVAFAFISCSPSHKFHLCVVILNVLDLYGPSITTTQGPNMF
jgi:hypothetical protein